MSKLYLCPTPIGNLEDITLRTLRVLQEVDYICAEDTRHSIKLLRHFDIEKPLISYHEHNKYDKLPDIMKLLVDGYDIAVVTDAGTPAISDPGEVLVKECINTGIKVEPLPGATALVTALVASGKSTRAFAFEGFLPQDKKDMQKVIERTKDDTRTLIFYEAPHRLIKTLKIFLKYYGNRELTLCRELTKIHEEFIYTTLEDAIEIFEARETKGEFVLVFAGRDEAEILQKKLDEFNELTLDEHMDIYIKEGYTQKDAMKMVAKDRHVSKREIYKELKGKNDE